MTKNFDSNYRTKNFRFFSRNWTVLAVKEKRGENDLEKSIFYDPFIPPVLKHFFLNGAQNRKSLERHCHLTHTASFTQRNAESAIL